MFGLGTLRQIHLGDLNAADVLPLETPEAGEVIGTGDEVLVYLKTGTFRGVVLETNVEAQAALVKFWDTNVETHYTYWFNCDEMQLWESANAPVFTSAS